MSLCNAGILTVVRFGILLKKVPFNSGENLLSPFQDEIGGVPQHWIFYYDPGFGNV